MFEIKKKLVLVPSAFSGKVLNDINPFIEMYKEIFDVYVISNLYTKAIVEDNGVYYVKGGRGSYADYLIYTADYLIDAGAVNSKSKVCPNQKRISVWHGIPYKKMFIDYDKKYAVQALNYCRYYDLMLSPSKYYTEKFLRKSMLYNGEVLEHSIPRFEYLLNNMNDKLIIDEIKKELGLPLDRKILLYAPTLRTNNKSIPLNFKELKNALGEEWIIITKAHYMNEIGNNPGVEKDLTHYPYTDKVLLISDMLITDYSSIMFDFSLLNRNIILYQYDYEDYAQERGFMFDILEYHNKDLIVYNQKDLFEVCSKVTKEKNHNIDNKIADTFCEFRQPNAMNSLFEKLNLNSDTYKHKEITFLINDLNQIGGIHTFVYNLGMIFKKHLQCRVNVIAIRQESTDNKKYVIFDPENNFDFKGSSRMLNAATSNIINNTDGYIISCQFSAHKHFQHLLEGKKVTLMFHGDMNDFIDSDLYSWQFNAIKNRTIYNYSNFLVLTDSNARELKENINDKDIKESIGYIENSIDFSDRINLQKNSKTYVAVTRLSEDKNIFALLNIFESEKLDKDIKLEVYGDGALRDEFQNEINKRQLEDKIILKGFCEDKEVIFKDKQGLISTSLTEGFPLVFLEAIKYYVPVIAFNSFVAASEAVGQCGMLIEIDDFDSFVKAMNNGFNINETIFNDHQKKFSNEGVLDKWVKLFENLENDNNQILKLSSSSNKSLLKNLKNNVKKYIFKGRRFLKHKLPNPVRRNIIYMLQMIQYYLKGVFLIKQPLVSIIIPYYYSSETIGATIKSVEKMKYKNIEMIIVNDGSDDYIPPKNKKIRYYNQEKNVGPGLARNFGVSKAKGKYICFLDGDDKLTKHGLSFLVKYAEENNLDIVAGRARRLDLSNMHSHIWFKGIYNKTYVNYKKERNKLLKDAITTNKIYNLEAYKKHNNKFEAGLYEDKLFTTQIYHAYDKIGIVNKDFYIWNVYGANTSISTSLSIENFFERVSMVDKLMNLSNEFNRTMYYTILVNHDFKIHIRVYNNLSDEDKRNMFDKMVEIANKWKEYYIKDYITAGDNIEYMNNIFNNDFDRFDKTSSIFSELYLEDKNDN